MHRLRAPPSRPRRIRRSDHQLLPPHLNLDLVMQSRLLQQRFRNPNPPRITDLNQSRSHDYNLITSAAPHNCNPSSLTVLFVFVARASRRAASTFVSPPCGAGWQPAADWQSARRGHPQIRAQSGANKWSRDHRERSAPALPPDSPSSPPACSLWRTPPGVPHRHSCRWPGGDRKHACSLVFFGEPVPSGATPCAAAL